MPDNRDWDGQWDDDMSLTFIKEAQAGGVPHAEILSTIRRHRSDLPPENNITGTTGSAYPTPKDAAVTALTVGGAAAGGPIANVALRATLPKLAARVPGPIVSAAGQAIGSLPGYKASGMSWLDAIKSALETGMVGGSVEAGGNLAARAGANIANIDKSAVDEALKPINPVTSAKLTRFPKWLIGGPPENQADTLAGQLAANLKSEKAGNIPMVGMEKAQLAMKAASGEIDAAPIKAKLQSMKRQPIGGKMPTAGEEIANEGIDDAIERLPDKFNNADQLHEYLQRIRQPIADTLGRPVKSLVANDAKELQAFIADYRDQKIGLEGAKGFAEAHQRMNDIEKVLPSLVDEKGNLRPTAENMMKRTGNAEIMRRLQAADPSTAEAVKRLAIQNQWSKKTTNGVGWFFYKKLARPVAKFSAVTARPAGIVSAATNAFLTAMQQPTDMEKQMEMLKRPNP